MRKPFLMIIDNLGNWACWPCGCAYWRLRSPASAVAQGYGGQARTGGYYNIFLNKSKGNLMRSIKLNSELRSPNKGINSEARIKNYLATEGAEDTEISKEFDTD